MPSYNQFKQSQQQISLYFPFTCLFCYQQWQNNFCLIIESTQMNHTMSKTTHKLFSQLLLPTYLVYIWWDVHSKKRLVYDCIWLFLACIPLIYQNFCIALCIPLILISNFLMTFVYQPYTNLNLYRFIYRKQFFLFTNTFHIPFYLTYPIVYRSFKFCNVFLLMWIVILLKTY